MKVKCSYYFLILVRQSELVWQKMENLFYVTYVKGSTTSCISLPVLPSRRTLVKCCGD
ncbi:hypothetical protein SETIT_5G090400v2 [Setaria italica]|uniref:Uncharacterized protein n=2 Tax=Setaria TaxID=4554 RepID=A0A368R2T6_SETIT|nr:hypothetical protein SETIT_5G090400v2 [Setaria italica]TKW13258.1 hypothetical protein SEVIR_5G088750v2 [Setaria viridis]